MFTDHLRPVVLRVVHACAAVVVVLVFIRQVGPFSRFGAWDYTMLVVSVAAWLLVVMLPRGLGTVVVDAPQQLPGAPRRVLANPFLFRVRPAIGVVGVAAAGLELAPSDSVLMVPLAILLITLLANPVETPWVGVGIAVVAAAAVPFGCVVVGAHFASLLALEATVVVWTLVGYNRRQSRLADLQSRELTLQALSAREEHARAAVLADRQAAARDIHDVLAHSLGGLVIQLDAVEALLESGRVQDASGRVVAARSLAADGLRDARRAVATLRSSDEHPAADAAPATAETLLEAVEQLITVHRSLGGTVALNLDADLARLPAQLPAAVSEAFERALQEGLSNARKHAPGEPVDVTLANIAGVLQLVIANPLAREGDATRADTASGAAALAGSGGGQGIAGMRERFAALPEGAVDASARAGRFMVAVRARVEGLEGPEDAEAEEGAGRQAAASRAEAAR